MVVKRSGGTPSVVCVCVCVLLLVSCLVSARPRQPKEVSLVLPLWGSSSQMEGWVVPHVVPSTFTGACSVPLCCQRDQLSGAQQEMRHDPINHPTGGFLCSGNPSLNGSFHFSFPNLPH